MLPVIEHPLFHLTIPSLQKEVLFRPFLVKEEKILLMAQQAGDNRQIILAIKQVINNCLQSTDVDVNDLTMFDIEYLFIKLRASSIDNNATVVYIDPEDEKQYQFDINMDEITLSEIPETRSKLIDLGDGYKVKMRYITADAFENIPEELGENTLDDFLITSAIEAIYSGDEMTKADDLTFKELNAWVENLSIPTRDEMLEFIESTPHILYEIKYTNSLDHERTIRLTSLRDFFTWG